MPIELVNRVRNLIEEGGGVVASSRFCIGAKGNVAGIEVILVGGRHVRYNVNKHGVATTYKFTSDGEDLLLEGEHYKEA